ncbi:crossover junction endodeoxyribonuclease RuvC [Patescibacteria group bacterium]|nr:crossover junction endodeoxyribonuclease RuvC [Patescibacteria group bacterium]MBU1015853.1 crossover junction endodeoxyribonuclease RuvC [Patescibacteria group bacterium]MBU1685398.1 crossover junction endodeoxyribonuclease RuvC [Patescibacteria group bacterium]MBU1938443.1 crossover junction endodeoxyribonuclease RuvC [Patescibacteria group bacterium]
MYFLGIDPGLSEVGFGIIMVKDDEPEFVDCGIIKTVPADSLAERLTVIKRDLAEILSMHKYAAVGVEELFFVKNITNGIKVAHARGVIMAEAHERGLPIHEMKPTEVKSNICGSGQADKTQVQEMVRRLLNLNSLPKPHDAADALAIAILTARLHKH